MTERVKAIISAAVIIAVNIANILGYNIDADATTNMCLTAAAFVALAYGIYKNHNFTDAAAAAQEYLDDLKSTDGDDEAPYN